MFMELQGKKDIRKKIIEYRDSIDSNVRKQWDENIFNKLINSELYKKAHTIFSFVSFKSEVDTHNIIKHAIKNGKTICVPKIESKQKGIEIFKIRDFTQLKKGYFDILEPDETCPAADSSEIDLILMPGVAFDKLGGRIGYGAGFYDRFLSNMKKRADKIALAYDFQLLDSIPMDEHDVSIDGIITEKGIIFTGK
jgi:5-formyltetrahydrofolate cyclo-ligase